MREFIALHPQAFVFCSVVLALFTTLGLMLWAVALDGRRNPIVRYWYVSYHVTVGSTAWGMGSNWLKVESTASFPFDQLRQHVANIYKVAPHNVTILFFQGINKYEYENLTGMTGTKVDSLPPETPKGPAASPQSPPDVF